jgi:hypothetical protein
MIKAIKIVRSPSSGNSARPIQSQSVRELFVRTHESPPQFFKKSFGILSDAGGILFSAN